MHVAGIFGAVLSLLLAADPAVPTEQPPAATPAPSPAPTSSATPEAPAPAATAPAPPPAAPAAQSHAGQMRGTVTYGRNQPSAGAMVIVRPESAPTPIRAATTGAAGGFAFDGLTDGVYRADVSREGYAPVLKPGIVVRAPFRAIFEVVLQKGNATPEPAPAADGAAALSGTVRASAGAALPEAHVRLTRPDGTVDGRSVDSDVKGAFALSDLRAGRWHLEIQAAGFLPLRTDLDLASDVSLEAQLASQPADYKPPARDLLLPEDVIPPKSTASPGAGEAGSGH